MPRYLIIDGYNAINKIEELREMYDALEARRTAFIKMLKSFMSQKNIFDKVFIVFDSKEEALGIRRHAYGNIEVLFTTADKDADSVIVDILRNASIKDDISVSSDDNFVRNHAKVYGRDVLSIKELQGIIMLKKKLVGRTIKEDILGRDAAEDINEELKRHWGLE